MTNLEIYKWSNFVNYSQCHATAKSSFRIVVFIATENYFGDNLDLLQGQLRSFLSLNL